MDRVLDAEAISRRAGTCGVELSPAAAAALAAHAAAVLESADRLHLTSILEPGAFLERHLGEAFEGAAMVDRDAEGILLDLGSGNGYPGLPLAAALPRIRPVLAESSARKAAFLREVVARSFPAAEVFEGAVRRVVDLGERSPVRLLVTRAMGDWARVVPRLTRCIAPDGQVLLWAGDEVEAVARRAAWHRLRLTGRRALPGRERSWIWCFARSRSTEMK